MIRTFFTLIAITLLASCSGQIKLKPTVVENTASWFALPTENDTIDFLVLDTTLNEKKPVLLWCQGSLPSPLFCEIEGYGNYFFGGGISNFNYKAISKKYHLVVISMPKTPLMAKKENLNPSFLYVPDNTKPNEFSQDYLEADYLENYVNRANTVLNFLSQQDWVDKSQLVVAGHSQGAKIATKVARTNAFVTHLGMFGANPYRRIDMYIRGARQDAALGYITEEAADSIIKANYAFYRDIHNPDSIAAKPLYKTWHSFSETFYDDWLELDIPIYLAYGTEDVIADLCDLVPLHFIEKGKDNLTIKRYIGLNHNFFEVTENGRPDRKKKHWNEVMSTFIEYLD